MACLSSRTIEYHHIIGDKRSVSQLGHSPQWEKVSKAKGNIDLYEKICPANVNITKDHVLIYPTVALMEDC